MGTGTDLRWLRDTAHLPLELAARCLSISGLKLHLLETQGHDISEEVMEGVRAAYYANQLPAPAEPREEEYVPGTSEEELCFPHWWHIDSPAGPTSQGQCTRCGASRTFENSGDYSGRE